MDQGADRIRCPVVAALARIGRDHTTVLHAVRKIETLASSDSTLAEEIELLKRLLQEP